MARYNGHRTNRSGVATVRQPINPAAGNRPSHGKRLITEPVRLFTTRFRITKPVRRKIHALYFLPPFPYRYVLFGRTDRRVGNRFFENNEKCTDRSSSHIYNVRNSSLKKQFPLRNKTKTKRSARTRRASGVKSPVYSSPRPAFVLPSKRSKIISISLSLKRRSEETISGARARTQ